MFTRRVINKIVASRQALTETLVWMWTAIGSIAFFSVVAFGSIWPSQLLVFAGLLCTAVLLRQARAGRRKRVPVPHLSGASKCVWQMDREA